MIILEEVWTHTHIAFLYKLATDQGYQTLVHLDLWQVRRDHVFD